MEKSRYTGSPSELIEEIADSMRKFDFPEDAIEKMKEDAAKIESDLLEHMVEIIHKAVLETTKWNYH
jgi:hypothetical protein